MRFKKLSLFTALLAGGTLAGCQTGPVEVPVVPVSTSHVLPAGTIGDDVVSRVGVSTLIVPGNETVQPVVQNDFLQAFSAMGFETRKTANGFIVYLPSDAHFDLNKAALKPSLVSKLRLIVNEANKSYLANYQIQVSGHTDSVGSSGYNQRLSEQRAVNVKQKMASLGSARNRLSSIGYGESRPRSSGPAINQANRRIDLLFSK